MRSLPAIVFVLAAMGCHRAKPTGPAWPAPSTTADDGGESIEPRATAVATSIEESDEPDVADAAPAAEIVAKPTASAPEVAKPATVSPPTQPTSDDVIITEDIIIEIDD